MGINKAVNRTSKSVGGMRNCLEYVLRDQKVLDGYVTMTGPALTEITWDTVYHAFRQEKIIWGKENGRLYAHNIISFHKDERITPEQVLEIALEVAEQTFPDHQTLIAVHQDKDHLHAHLVTNTVSYVDGHKLHTTKYDLENMKQLTNQLCSDMGLSIAHKGEHYDGTKIEESAIISWSKDKYQSLIKEINAVLIDCVASVLSAKAVAVNKEDFIDKMSEHNWDTVWEDNRKHITFINDAGKKIRDSNISKNYSVDISKESLEATFKLNVEQQLSPQQYDELVKQQLADKELKYSLESRIKSLLQYINDCPESDFGKKVAKDKVDSLKSDVVRIDIAIEKRDEKIRTARVIKQEIIDASEEQIKHTGLKINF